MPLFTDYSHRENFFFRLDPRTKLVWLVAVSVAGLTATNPLVPLGLIVASLATARAAELKLEAFRLLALAVAALAAPLLIIQVLFQPEGSRLVSVGSVDVTSGAIVTTLRIVLGLLCLSSAFVEFILWTHPMDLAQVMVRWGLPYRFAMLFGLGLRFFPVLEQELGSIMDAQAARGFDNQGFWTRGRQVVLVLVPFCLRSIRRSGEVALAMELRGYGYAPQRTFLRQVAFRRVDAMLTGGMVLLALGYALVRLSSA